MQRKQLENIKTDVVTLQEGIKLQRKRTGFLNQLRPSNVSTFIKIHNAYTFEIKTGTNAPNASYKVMNLTKTLFIICGVEG